MLLIALFFSYINIYLRLVEKNRLKADVISQLVETEQTQAGVWAAEVTSLHTAEETMPQTYGGTYDTEAYAIDEGNHLRVAAQLVAEMVKRLQPLLGLGHKVVVVLEGTEAGGIVKMGDGDARPFQLLAPKHILVAVVAEALVERMLQHHLSGHQEVTGVEVHKRPLAPLLNGMLRGTLPLIDIAQARFFALADDISAVDDGAFRSGRPRASPHDRIRHQPLQISPYEVIADDSHVAVHEQEPLVVGLTGQEIAYCRPPAIHPAVNEPAMRQLLHLTAEFDAMTVSRTVVGHYNLVSYWK